MELRVAHIDGRWVDVEVIGNNIVTDGVVEGYVVTVRDITERAEASAALRASEERYRVVLNALNEGVAVVCRDGTMLTCNPVGQEILGVNGDARSTSLNIYDFAPEVYGEDGTEIPRDERPMVRAFATGREASATLQLRRRDGRLVWLDVRAVPMPGEAYGHQVVVSAVDITERKEAEQALARQATHDPLTGLANRTLLYDRLGQALARRRRLPGNLAVMFLDIDRFKWLNDSLGHAAGDEVLVEVAARLTSALRGSDTVARFGGDEFVVLCEDVASEEQAVLLARHLSECVSFPVSLGLEETTPSVSIGIALASATADASVDALLRDADAAMYHAKERGRGGSEVFDADIHVRAVERQELESSLRRAIVRGELRVHYQPEIDLSTDEVLGVEALVRWAHPERGLIAPSEFIPLAEETGLIVPLGAAVLREACGQIAAWQHAHPDQRPLLLSVNIGARQLLGPGLRETVSDALAASGLRPSSLCLEITETVFVEEGESSASALRELKALGIRIGVDDFGTGYSSLAYLKRFPVDVLKIDRSFVKGLGASREDRAIVSSIVDVAHAFGLATVAEGVETVQQLEHLRAIGCEQGQGWYWQPAMPAAMLARWLEARVTPAAPTLPPGAGGTRTLIVDDDRALRGLLRCTFDGDENFQVVGEAADGRQAVALARQHQPDLVVLDLAMPGLGGLEALPLILGVAPHATAVVWSNLDAHDVAAQALERGAVAYLSKDNDPEQLLAELLTLCTRRQRNEPGSLGLHSERPTAPVPASGTERRFGGDRRFVRQRAAPRGLGRTDDVTVGRGEQHRAIGVGRGVLAGRRGRPRCRGRPRAASGEPRSRRPTLTNSTST